MAVDDHTRYKSSGFVKGKSEIWSFATEVLKKVKAAGHTVKYVCRYNEGENTKQLREACEEERGIIQEFAAPYTSEQNGVVE